MKNETWSDFFGGATVKRILYDRNSVIENEHFSPELTGTRNTHTFKNASAISASPT